MARKENVPAALVLPTVPQTSFEYSHAQRYARDSSPPRTPPSAAAPGKGKLRGPKHRSVLREAFSDEPAKGSAKTSNRQRGDSHDLQWTPRQTRDSVVDNMLLSLDQLALAGGTSAYGAHDADPISSAPVDFNTLSHLTTSRRRGHTFSSSLSSDVGVFNIEPPTRTPDQPSRRHRSNSSTNFYSALGRIDSVRAADENTPPRNKDHILQKTMGNQVSKEAKPKKGRQGSQGNGLSSVDISHTLNNSGWQHGFERRPSSSDQGHRNQAPFNTDTTARHPDLSSTAQQLTYDHDDAAPTPTIPAGPSGSYSPKPVAVYPLPSPRASAQTLPLRHRDSKKAPATLFSRHEQDNSTDMVSSREERGPRLHTSTNSRDTPVAAGTWNGFGQSPAVSSRKPSNSMQTSGNQSKEKAGFFRRMFSSSRINVSSLSEYPSQQTLPASLQAAYGSEIRFGQASPNLTSKTASKPREMHPSVMQRNSKDVIPGTLNKKPSFFRRRKKSISEDIPLPVPQLLYQPKLQTNQPVQPVETSPVSSLRKVMDPYLSNSNGTSQSQGTVDRTLYGTDEAGLPVDPTIDSLISGSDHLLLDNDTTYRSGRDRDHTLSSKRDAAKGRNRARGKDEALAELSLSQPLPSTSTAVSDNIIDPMQPVPQDSMSHHNSMKVNVKSDPKVSDSVNNMMLTKENKPITSGASHSRTGSNKDLPMLPNVLQPLSLQDNNAQPLTYPSFVPKRTTSKDKRGTSALPTPTNEEGSPRVSTPRSQRVWLQPTASEEDISAPSRRPSEAKSIESIASDYKSATSKLPTPTVESSPQAQDQSDQPNFNDDIPQHDVAEHGDDEQGIPEQGILEHGDDEPIEEERAHVKRIYDGVDELVGAAGAAAWLGDAGIERARVRKAYMELFDWNGLNILGALRGLCNQLLMRGETQQVDRIIDAFSHRWCACNPKHGFIATDVVHTICYSILLLNTDLHMADIENKMTRSQFVRNTMPTIRRVATDAAPNAFESSRTSILTVRPHVPGPTSPNQRASTFPLDKQEVTPDIDLWQPTERRVAPELSELIAMRSPAVLDSGMPVDAWGLLVNAPFFGRLQTWEAQVEIVLKDFYYSIRQDRLPLSGKEDTNIPSDAHPSSSNLSTFANGMLRRTPSMLSKAGSEGATSRGRLSEARMGTGRWSSKTRSRPRLFPASIIPPSRGSYDDESDPMSPSASSVWSKRSLGKTPTSMSVNSYASNFQRGDYQQSIGFANALSQAMFREETSGVEKDEESVKVTNLLEDDRLELRGAPWAKEGMLKHKHHLELADKRAKDRQWNECFAVIEKGWLRLFQFNTKAKSMRIKARNQKSAGVVGGGNWMENAEPLGKFLLRQTVASALPPPGYSALRPHVWALSLPTGAVHLFHAGTPEIVQEFVTTANYWSARLSKEPLVGGVSNMEYGWSDGVINTDTAAPENRPASNLGHRPSLQSSLRSSLDQGNSRPKLPADKITITDWTPPKQSMMTSALMEVDQLRALKAYVATMEADLQRHNDLRGPMMLAYTPGKANAAKAMANWERKSTYLTQEVVKFRTYCDTLNAAQAQKAKVQAELAPMPEGDENENDEDLCVSE